MKTPFLLVGDGPNEPSGLGRIGRELGQLISGNAESLGLDFVQAGGPHLPPWFSWRHVPIDPSNDDWGASQVQVIWESLWGQQPGVLFCVWDPSRLFAYSALEIPAQKWAYTAVDSENINGSIGGPGGEAVRRFDRILAYGPYGAGVIKSLRGPTQWLPHGLGEESVVFTSADELEVQRLLGPFWPKEGLLVGCVAANQARKDLALYFATLAELKGRGHRVYGWLHTNLLVKDWSVQQLVHDYGLARQVTVTTPPMDDRQLQLLYAACDVTVAPGLGEGFGYPIVESLRMGVPVVHGDFAGGASLVPKLEWRFPTRERRVESVYAMQRPVYRAGDVANAIERMLGWRDAVGRETVTAYCRGSVDYLRWERLWPRWRSWIKQGL